MKAFTSSSDALQKVLQGNYSCKSLSRNQGVGISNLALMVTNSAGKLSIISGGAAAEVAPGRPRPRMQMLNRAFPGTAVFFTMEFAKDAETAEKSEN